MRICGFFLFVIFIVAGCGDKTPRGDEQTMTAKEFFELFQEKKLPFSVSDTSLGKSRKDTVKIRPGLLARFLNDSLMIHHFGKNTKAIFYPLGRVDARKNETYLFLEAALGSRHSAYLLAFDHDTFKALLPLVINDGDPQTVQTAGIDTRYTISVNKQRKKSNGDLGYKRDAYVYNNVGSFTLILTESNENTASPGEIINPIDTLSRKAKYSADYVKDKRNFISVRDGRKPSVLRFFVHFEKNQGSCKGELRGEATIVRPNVAVFRESGDPCVLEFTFTSNSVSMKELEGCGNYRDIRCFFEGSYPKKKEAKAKASSRKK